MSFGLVPCVSEAPEIMRDLASQKRILHKKLVEAHLIPGYKADSIWGFLISHIFLIGTEEELLVKLSYYNCSVRFFKIKKKDEIKNYFKSLKLETNNKPFF